MNTKDSEFDSLTSSSKIWNKSDKIRIAYVDEPPFYWTAENNQVKGADIELIEAVLYSIGVSSIEYVLTKFEELLPGVQSGRWDMNVPIFVTPERAKEVAFSTPVWSIGDGFVVLRDNPKGLTSYDAIALRADARLGLIPGQVQIHSAKRAGVPDSQIIMLNDQHEVVEALLAGEIDAFAATALGNSAIAKSNPAFESVALKANPEDKVPVGAFSFSKSNDQLLEAVNEQLHKYLGSADHRKRMAKFGITENEIDGVLKDKR
jgi:polar amino acid transport system substrate-binding protein